MKASKSIAIAEQIIHDRIYFLRGKKVMLDFELAELYGVETKRLKEQVKRNIDRFPSDFMFELNDDEFESLRSQFATSKSGRGGMRYMPMAFTEHGVLMLSSVLNSEQAISVNIQIMRIFTKMKELLQTHKDILLKLELIEKKLLKQDEKNKKVETEIQTIFHYLKQLLAPENRERNRIGYKRD